MNYFGYDSSDYIPCEICKSMAVDIHHIEARGMGGTKDPKANSIENLMALCRSCHEYYGDKKQYKNYLKGIHLHRMRTINL
jgi:5-methylcytosine-specific restriction endonuclease McrA